MTKVEAYIRTHLVKQVQDALEELHVSGLTVSDVRGMGHSKAVTHTFRGNQYVTSLNPRAKIEVLVHDEEVEEVVQSIQRAAHTGEVGDGKIVLYKVDDVVRIRTGERGDTALK
jgi:nitrogen regulatory protein P-II 1